MPCQAMIPDHFIEHIKHLFGFDLIFTPLSKTGSSNTLLKLSDGKDDYVAKIYDSSYPFNTELTILFKCKEKLKMPHIVYYEEKEQFGWNWIMYRYIRGTSLFELKNSFNKISSHLLLFSEIGSELRKFHDIKLIYKLNKIEKRNIMERIISQTETAYNMISKTKNDDLFLHVINFLRNTYPLLANRKNDSIIIQDFNDKHIIIQTDSTTWSLSGILDFEQAIYSNKFLDVVSLYIDYFFDNEDLEISFWKGYNTDIITEDKKLIAFFILQYALKLCGILKDVYPANRYWGEDIISKVFIWLNRVC
jgi:aminoglycoside phosphotransferase (APT) family kinase protein